jgi:hypothetical protein
MAVESATPNTAWHNAIGNQEIAVPLAALPQGVVLGESLDEPIWYDANRKLLCFRGFMCSASYTHLRRLSHDAAYLIALEKLYMGSSVEQTPRRRAVLWIAIALTVAIAAYVVWMVLR